MLTRRLVLLSLLVVAAWPRDTWGQLVTSEAVETELTRLQTPVRAPLPTRWIQQFGGDISSMWSDELFLWLAFGGGLTLAAGPEADHDVVQRVAHDATFRGLFRVGGFNVGDALGQHYTHLGIPAAVAITGVLTRNESAVEAGSDLIRAQLVNGLITRTLKLTPRRRPSGGHASFPSGHTSASFTTAAVLWRRWGWKVGLPAVAVATYVGASRLDRHHYLSDIAFGATIGTIVGTSIKINARQSHLTVAPVVNHDAVGVAVTVR
jgi:membrane-associated phospholipid phosphatase